jgi:hypothetical protein
MNAWKGLPGDGKDEKLLSPEKQHARRRPVSA